MPLLSTEAKNDSLDNDYGPAHGTASPASFLLLLFTGGAPAPDGEGVEVTNVQCPGYVRTAVAHADFPDAEDGQKSALVQTAAPTDEWTKQIDCWVLADAADPTDLREYGFPDEPLEVTSASPTGPLVEVTIFYDTDLED